MRKALWAVAILAALSTGCAITPNGRGGVSLHIDPVIPVIIAPIPTYSPPVVCRSVPMRGAPIYSPRGWFMGYDTVYVMRCY